MRYPNMLNYRKWIKYHFIFFLGALFGVLIFLLFFGKELDRLHLTIESQGNEIGSCWDQLKKCEENQAKVKQYNKLVVENVEVHILDPKPDAFTEAELIQLIGRDTKYLEGKTLDSLNELHLSIRQQFKDRRYIIRDRPVVTELKTITIYKTVHLYVHAKAEQPAP